MRSRPLAAGRLSVTELGFGAASIGNLYKETDDTDARQAVAAAYDAGIRYFDTAPHYGLGLSELRLGRALAAVPRDTYVLSTKVGRALDVNPSPTGSDLAAGGFAVPDDRVRRWDFSADGVRRSLEQSLERLGTDHVDVVYVHDPDDHLDQAIGQAVPALLELREQGVIGLVGVGMNQWEAPLRVVRETDVDVVMVAGRWTLLDRTAEPLLDACVDLDVSVVAAAPFNSGLLANDRPASDTRFDYLPASDQLLRRVHALADTCEKWDTRLPAAAVQFPLRHPAVVSVVAGLRSQDQVAQYVDRRSATVPAAAWPELGA